MKKRIIAIISVIILLAGVMLCACSRAKDEKTLVAYFSATGSTKAVATQLAAETGADLFELVPKVPYTEVQLGYDDPEQRITKEQADAACRVEIAGTLENFEQYDTVYIGYPIWYGKVPRIILTFLESYSFEGKRIIPFCTSDSDGIETGLEEIKKLAPGADWQDGQRFDGAEIRKATDKNGTVTDEKVKEEIAVFAEKTLPRSDKASRGSQSGNNGTTAKGSEEAPFEEGSDTTADSKNKDAETESQTQAEPAESTTATTTTTTTKKAEPTSAETPSDAATEPETESTTLGDHDTPFIPIP